MTEFSIAGRRIGPGYAPYIIAELSGNHNGSLDRALAIVAAAADAGADAVKLQTLTPEGITMDHDGPGFVVKGGLWDGRRLFDLYRETALPFEWHEPIFRFAKSRGLHAFSSVFDSAGLAFLESLDTPAYKIASLELFDLPLIREVAATGRPMIMSSGTAHLGDIELAVDAARSAGNDVLAVLHCTSSYPADISEANISTIAHLAQTFGVVAGLSDHTMGTVVSVAAVACGAAIIEKHLTLARADGGADAAFSMEPDEFARLVADCRSAAVAVGKVTYGPTPGEQLALQYRRSLYVVKAVKAGEVFTTENVRSIRPGFGLPPRHLPEVLGGVAACDLERGTPLQWGHVRTACQ